jgi:hypothetical protein
MRLTHLVIIAALAGCSTIDPGDEAELANALPPLSTTNPTHFQLAAASHIAREWLKSRTQNDQVMKIECRAADPSAPDGWGPWAEYGSVLVSRLLQCMTEPGDHSYGFCGQLVGDEERDTAEIRKLQSTGIEHDCRWTWDFRYDPQKLPVDIDPKKVTVKDEIRWLVALPAPPPGFSPVELGPILVPLCGLAAGGWGCPDNPNYPGDRSGQ